MVQTTCITFSPTGGGERVVDALCSGLPWARETIDLLRKDMDFEDICIPEDHLAIIAMPSYAGRAPGIAMERLRQIRGNHTRCILVAVYGNRAVEDTLIEMYDAALACGFIPVAAVSAIAEHSMDRQIAQGRPDAEDIQLLREYGMQLAVHIETLQPLTSVAGNRPYRAGMDHANCPGPDSSCTQCGQCADACPVDAINDYMIGDATKCISCMRCIRVCTFRARGLDHSIVERVHAFLSESASARKEPELYIG